MGIPNPPDDQQVGPADGELPSGYSFGKYRVVGQIGEGAFSTVYEAIQPGPMGFAKRVALKRLHPDLLRRDPLFLKSLAREARIGGMMHHANIVDILELVQVGSNWALAMEFVDGLTVAQLIRRCREQSTLLPPGAIVALGIQACRGLHYAHTLRDPQGHPLQLIHRDIKPSNLIIDRAGTAKILDFGVARASERLQQTTLSHLAQGTPRYMSPEQAANGHALCHRSDLFSLAVVLYELITTRPLYQAQSLPALIRQLDAPPDEQQLEKAEAVLPGSAALLRQALARDPQDRPVDAQAMADGLRELDKTSPPTDLGAIVEQLNPFVAHTASFDEAELASHNDNPDELSWSQSSPLATVASLDADQTDGQPSQWSATPTTDSPRTPRRRWLIPILAFAIGMVVTSVLFVVPWSDAEDVGEAPRVTDAVKTRPAMLEASPSGEGPTPGHRAPIATAGESVESVPAPVATEPVATPGPVADPAGAAALEAPPTALEAGTISLYSRPWSEISIDGTRVVSANRLASHPLPGGEHEIRLSCTTLGGREKVYTVQIDGDDVNLGCWDFHQMAPCLTESP